MIDWIPLINKISIPIIKKLISCFRNRPFVKVTAELGLKNGIHAVVINSNRNHISTVLNTDEEAIKIYCVNETSHRCVLDRLEIEFECGNIQRISLENVELVEGKKTSRDIALSQLNINNSPEYRRIKKITIFDTVRGEWKVDSNNINLLNKELHNLFSESNQ